MFLKEQCLNRTQQQWQWWIVSRGRGRPLQSVPEAADDTCAVGAGDGLPLGAADVMKDVVAALHGHLHSGAPLGGVQGPGC